jgi:hypothetical protein
LEDFYKINKSRFNIFIIYISEAHAADVWPIGMSAGTINYSHKHIEDRITCAKKMVKTFDLTIPMYCDNMNNEFQNEMACWPFRFFVVKKDILVHIGQPEDSSFELDSLMDFINI